MEQQVAQLLADTQSNNESSRKQAELQLRQLYHDPNFPLALVSLASHGSVPLNIRQSSLLVCKKFVELGWSPNLDEFGGEILINDDNKATVRQTLLSIALSDTDERKVKSAASLVVSKIATADFPEDWPNLLDDLLALIPQASDARLHGALKVLQDLIEDCLNEEQFFKAAHDLVRTLYGVATDEARKTTLRALAISAFRSSFDTLEMIMEDHKSAVKGFAEQTLAAWMPFYLSVLKITLPENPRDDAENEDAMAYRGMVALKLQVVKVVMRIRAVFPSVLAPQSLALFSAVWEELNRLQKQYHDSYITDDHQGRLEDADGLPYTLDFLILEELDFLQACLRAPPVRKELEKQLQSPATAGWVAELIKLTVSYSHITTEEEGLWDIDVNVFLSEESSLTANYTPRTACSDLLIKLSEWIPDAALNGLLSHAKTVYATESSWKTKEATLYVLDVILRDIQSVEKTISPDFAHAYVEFVSQATQQQDDFLRARGHLVAGTLVKTSGDALAHVAQGFMESCLNAMLQDESDIVKVSCVRALQQYLSSIKRDVTGPLQSQIIDALSQYLSQQDLSDISENEDVVIALLETLRDAILLDTRICIHTDALRLLFAIASHGASSFQLAMLVTETFEEVSGTLAATGPEEFAQLCDKVVPSLLGAFDMTTTENQESQSLANLAAEILSVLTDNAPSPLPASFVSQLMPRLQRLLLTSYDEDLLRSATTAARYMLEKDAEPVFAWSDEAGKSGLEVLLTIVARLLGPEIDDNSGAEVGGLTAAIVEKAGSERLGPYLPQLLQAVAVRLSTAEKSMIIQSLLMVFVRLTVVSANEVIEFLAGIDMSGMSGLHVVITKWLENSVHFAGFEDIAQNNNALTKLYELSSPEIAQVMVKGDLIVPQTSRIITRSRAKQNPTEFTTIDANLKILKILVDELPSSTDPAARLTSSAAAAADDDEDDDDDDDEWEDDNAGFLDLGSGVTKADLMAYAGEGTEGAAWHRSDDDAQRWLLEWFKGVAHRPGFEETYARLNEGERDKLRALLG